MSNEGKNTEPVSFELGRQALAGAALADRIDRAMQPPHRSHEARWRELREALRDYRKATGAPAEPPTNGEEQ